MHVTCHTYASKMLNVLINNFTLNSDWSPCIADIRRLYTQDYSNAICLVKWKKDAFCDSTQSFLVAVYQCGTFGCDNIYRLLFCKNDSNLSHGEGISCALPSSDHFTNVWRNCSLFPRPSLTKAPVPVEEKRAYPKHDAALPKKSLTL